MTSRPPWRLPGLLRPGRRLFCAALAGAVALAWWFDQREMFWRIAGAYGVAFWLGGVATYCGLWKAAGWLETPTAGDAAVPAPLDPYEAAWLSGGAWRMVATALAMQVQRGVAVIEPSPELVPENSPPAPSRWRVVRADTPAHPVERAVASVARDGAIDVREARLAVEAMARDTGRRMRDAGLALHRNAFGAGRLAALAVVEAVLVLALMRLPHLLDSRATATAVFDLVFAMLAAGVVGVCSISSGRLTDAGGRALKPHLERANGASVARAKALGEEPEAGRARLGAQHPVDCMTVAVFACSAVVDDPRFDAAWHLWPESVKSDAWRGSGNVHSIHAAAAD